MMCKSLKFALIAAAVQSAAGQSCAEVCSRATGQRKAKCEQLCARCSGNNKEECINNEAKQEHSNNVREGQDRGNEAKTNCSSLLDEEDAFRRCIQAVGNRLPKPSDRTAGNRTRVFENLREFQKVTDDAVRGRKEQQFRSDLVDKFRMNASNSSLERTKRAMCNACINGTNETIDAPGIDRRFLQKLCVQKCVKRTLLDVEASDVKSCVANATSSGEKQACFCASRPDDNIREKLTRSGGASKRKGVEDFICDKFIACSENGEVNCNAQLSAYVTTARNRCTSGKERFSATASQTKTLCERKQVKTALDQCKAALGGNRSELQECVRETTQLSKGKTQKFERESMKASIRAEVIACRICKNESATTGSDEDCPDEAHCKAIGKAALKAQLGSECAGNYKALVENDLSVAESEALGEDEEVLVAKRACEVAVSFKAGRGQCRGDGTLRSEVAAKFSNDSISIAGVTGAAIGVAIPQIERVENGDVTQQGIITIALADNSSLTDDLIDAKCEELATSLQSDNVVSRRLAELGASDASEVTASQSTQTCAASDTSCQNTEFTGSANSGTTAAPSGGTTAAPSSGTNAAQSGGTATTIVPVATSTSGVKLYGLSMLVLIIAVSSLLVLF
jgi:hypothetical protein